MESQWQSVLPESLLLEIFYYLGLADLSRVSRVCKVWSRISQDEALWCQLTRNIWKVKGPLLPHAPSWKEEVKRLFYHVPLLETNCIEKHTDEVLDVAISHNGKYFCTVSKDSTIIMWDLEDPTNCLSEVNTGKDLQWMLTQYSVFNEEDTLVLVCGVREMTFIHEQAVNEPNGCGAVYTVPDLQLVSYILLEPFTLFGAWLDNRIFIAGLPDEERDCIHVRAYDCVNEYILKKGEKVNITQHAEKLLGHYAQHQTGLFSYEGSRLHQMNMITAHVPLGNTDSLIYRRRSNSTQNMYDNCTKGSRNVNKPEERRDSNNSDNKTVDYSDIHEDKYVLYGAEKNVHDTGLDTNSSFHQDIEAEVQESGFLTYVILVAGEHDVIQMYGVSDDHVDDIRRQFYERSYLSETPVIQPQYVFHIKNHYITGLCLSPDHRFAYFNHRAVSKRRTQDDQYDGHERSFSSELKIGIIDLVTMVRVKDIEYKGHIGFSNYSPWYICLDVSQDFIVSGSEDGRGYLWEKNYNTCLGVLNHKEGVVNGVAFSPLDQETCVTVCDDKLIKVWRSRHRQKQMERAKLDKLMRYNMKLFSQSNQLL